MSVHEKFSYIYWFATILVKILSTFVVVLIRVPLTSAQNHRQIIVNEWTQCYHILIGVSSDEIQNICQEFELEMI